MGEELVKLETAVLAKNKGFDLICSHYYDNGNSPSLYKMDNSNKDGFPEPSCPTQSALQRWLRETHNIHLSILYLPDHNTYIYNIVNYLDDYYDEHWGDNMIELTYEESLEEGLQEALKLIEL